MKRLILLICCLLFALPLAASADKLPFTPDSLVSAGNALYALSDDQVYRQDDASWELLPLDAPSRLYLMAGSEDTLWLVGSAPDADGYALYRLQTDALEKVCGIQWTLTPEDFVEFRGFVVQGDSAYILEYDDNIESWDEAALYRVSLADGQANKVTQAMLGEIAPYKDGTLLTIDWSEIALASIDVQTGTINQLAWLPSSTCYGLVYDADQDEVYYHGPSGAYRFDQQFSSVVQVGYLLPSPGFTDSTAAALHNGCYYAADSVGSDKVISCSIDPELLPARTLRVLALSDSMLRSFAKEHPEIALVYADDGVADAESYLRHSQSEEKADVYEMRMDSGFFDALRDKGYLLDLSSEQALSATIVQMYPHLTNSFFTDDGLWALPTTLSVEGGMGYNLDSLGELGLSAEDMPHTYGELMDLIARWQTELGDEYPDKMLFNEPWDLYTELFDSIVMAQMLHCEREGIPITFNTPTLRALLEQLESIHPLLDDLENSGMIAEDNAPILIRYDNPLLSQYGASGRVKPLVLALDDETSPVLPAAMNVMVINRASENSDIAMELLSYTAEHSSADFLANMMPGMDDPIETYRYAQKLEAAQADVAALEETIAKADPADRAELESNLEIARITLQEVEQNRWSVTVDDIAEYRETVAPYLVVSTSSSVSLMSSETRTLRQRYIDGQISAEQFLKELDRMVSMMLQERN